MSRHTPEHEELRRLARGYLLDTLRPAERARVETELAQSAAWQETLESERSVLATLDALPDEEPSGNLTARVMAGIDEVETEKQTRGDFRRRLWQTATVTAGVFIVVAIFALPFMGRTREASRRASSQNNLKQLGLIFKMYANESRGEMLPPLAPYEGVWTVDVARLYPEYMSDLSVLVNPNLPNADKLAAQLEEAASKDPIDFETITRIAAKSYTYTGWTIQDEETFAKVRRQYAKLEPEDRLSDLNIEGEVVYRLREGIERFFISDINNPAATAMAQSEIPIMFETDPASQPTPGCNVLFMDGHVEFIPLGDAFPALPEVSELLRVDDK